MQDHLIHTRRRWERQLSETPISLILEYPPFKAHDSAITVDISPRGVGVKTQLALVRGERLTVGPSGEFVQAMAAIVVWANYDESSHLTIAGLEFCSGLKTPPKNEPFHWAVLTPAEMQDIEARILGELGSLGVGAITTEWKPPSAIAHFTLVAETPWCANRSPATIARVKEHAIEKAEIFVPRSGFFLRKPSKREDFNQAVFRAMEETPEKIED